MAARGDHVSDRCGWPRKKRLDAAISAVANPPLQLAPPRLTFDPSPIADTLHPAPDSHLADRIAHLTLKPKKFRKPRFRVRLACNPTRQFSRRKALQRLWRRSPTQ